MLVFLAVMSFVVAAACVTAQNLGPLPRIKAGAGGLAPPEVRFTCPVDEARRFYTELSAEGRAQYLGPQRRLDTVFPVALAVFMVSVLLLGLPVPLGIILAALPVAAMVADLIENARIAELLRTAPEDLDDGELTAVGRIITVKFVLFAASFMATALGGLRWAFGL
ncbi:MAG: hypothetical protein AAGH83_05845 [Pseudomonadota bacterium]